MESRDIESLEDKKSQTSVAQLNTLEAATEGKAATTLTGQSLFISDPAAEKKLRRKIDLFIVPTVAMLYLFCFIDRANVSRLSNMCRHAYDPYLIDQ